MSDQPSMMDFMPEPRLRTPQTYAVHRAQIARNLSDIAKAVRIRGGIDSLTDLVYRLETGEYLEHLFMPFLSTYDWESHDTDPAKVGKSMKLIWDSVGGNTSLISSVYELDNIESFSECLAWWSHSIFMELEGLLSPYGDDFLWFPESRSHRDAFGYVLFLWMYLRNGNAPTTIVLPLYVDALSYLTNQFH
ncbi:hypothetical protein GGS24DRAFT_451769 [Hypoxylon argillaceum]|nr:hypothetical protein GGS24DRAFT_451769 [Hypoxylon argillaceum]